MERLRALFLFLFFNRSNYCPGIRTSGNISVLALRRSHEQMRSHSPLGTHRSLVRRKKIPEITWVTRARKILPAWMKMWPLISMGRTDLILSIACDSTEECEAGDVLTAV